LNSLHDGNSSIVERDKIVSLSKRRGFIFQSSEIYRGTGSCWQSLATPQIDFGQVSV